MGRHPLLKRFGVSILSELIRQLAAGTLLSFQYYSPAQLDPSLLPSDGTSIFQECHSYLKNPAQSPDDAQVPTHPSVVKISPVLLKR